MQYTPKSNGLANSDMRYTTHENILGTSSVAIQCNAMVEGPINSWWE